MRAAVLGLVTAGLVADAVGRWRPRPRHGGAPQRPTRRQRQGATFAAVLVAALVSPLVPAVALVVWWTRRRLAAARRTRAHARAVRRALPSTVDLLALASTAGLSLPVALPVVAAHAPPPLGPALAAAHAASVAGRPRADALLEQLTPFGERSRALAQVLVDHLRYGVPLLPALERTSLELRLDRRRAAEVDARRVPVRLLGPLVACILPAFGLLTVVPLLAASLEALPT